MKHIVMRYMSTRLKNFPYGCPGFGDIVHSCLIAYNYGLHHNDSATLHIAPHQYNRDKPQTWKQVIELFPEGSVNLKVHDFSIENDKLFLEHVQLTFPDALLHYYEKYPGKLQNVLQPSFFVDKYMKTYPCLSAKEQNVKLPSKFVTAQFDPTSKKRKLKTEQLQQLKDNWSKKGYEILFVGGQASDPLLKTAPYVGYAMSKAHAHLGVDSGYMHLAQIYFEPKNIYIYTNRKESQWEHHLKMFRDNGANINEYN
ncbi:MAG: hypothetical protein CMD92_08715 [Gammaproteobacteria bacterium]|nr:hypothetical protein [Gammaproteobacteria bacterium]